MSGVVKGVGKVFKKVVKVAKKIAIPVLVGTALVLTAGSACPALAAAGVPTWGGLMGAGGAAAGGAATLNLGQGALAMGGPSSLVAQGLSAPAGQGLFSGLVSGAIPSTVKAVAGYAKSNPLATMTALSGISGYYRDRAAMERMNEQMPDTGIVAFDLSGNPGRRGQPARFELDLIWYAAPSIAVAPES